jgi:DNA-directed RNA polymerase subunit RPC12/RpoP
MLFKFPEYYEDGSFVGQEIKIDELITIKTDDENPALMDLLQAFAAQGARNKDTTGYGIQYECSICHKKFLSEKVAHMHQLQMHNDYNIIPNDFNKDDKSSYKCQKCGVEFDASNFKVFLHHRKMIHKEYPYGCKYRSKYNFCVFIF